MRSFSERVVAITGAGSGIGRALAQNLAERGAHLALADVKLDGLEQTAQLLVSSGMNVTQHVVNVAVRDEVEQFATEVIAQHGAVHMIVNNAGVALVDRVETMSYADFEWLMQINFWGVVYGCKAFLPHLQNVEDAHIVNISSLFGLGAMPTQSAYNASKFAVRGFTEALRMEQSKGPVRVSSVHPGGVATEITENARIGSGSGNLSRSALTDTFNKLAVTTPDQAANQILRGVLRNKARILVGRDAWFMDKLIRLFPSRYEKILRLARGVPKQFK